MAPMPTMKPGKPDTSFLYAEADSGDSSPTPSSPPSSAGIIIIIINKFQLNLELELSIADPPKSQCSSLSDGESFEGYGENEGGGLLSLNNHHSNNSDSLRHSSQASSSDVSNNLNGSTGVQLELAPHGNSTPNV